MEGSPYEDLPEKVLAAFAGRTMLSATELAPVLDMHSQTLRALIAKGVITGRLKGVGKIRRRYGFTIADVAKYLHAIDVAEAREQKMLYYLREVSPITGATRNVRPVKRRRKPKIGSIAAPK